MYSIGWDTKVPGVLLTCPDYSTFAFSFVRARAFSYLLL